MGLITKLFGSSRKGYLGEILVREGLISRGQLQVALEHQRSKGYRLGYHLTKLGMIDDKTLGHFLAERFQVPIIDSESIHIHDELFEGIPPRYLLEREILPLNKAGNTLTLVMADPSDKESVDEISKRLNVQVHPVLAPQSVIRKHLAHYLALQEIRKNMGGGDNSRDLTHFFTRLKDYRFEKVLGTGGCGMVCKCWQISLDRPVAIKTMNREMTQIKGMSERFQREGKIIAQLNHPSIIQVFEQGESLGHLYIVMEHFEGRSIDAYCRGKDSVEKLGCLITLCDALHYAYGKGVVHRDLKPANILANDAGEVKLLDFGVAFYQESGESRHTQVNMVLGTPKYMAPECFHGTAEVGTEADIFAMGVIAYEILTGREPGTPPVTPPHEVNRDLPSVLSRALLKALEPDKKKRLASFDLFKRALTHCRDQMLMGNANGPQTGRIVVGPKQKAGAGASSTPTPAPTQNTESRSRDLQRAYQEEKVLRDNDEGRVIIAHHIKMNRRVVIKHIPERFIHAKTVDRLMDIKHPNIGLVMGSVRVGENRVLILEYLEGGTLAERMEGGPIGAENYVVWVQGMVAALDTARQRGVPHGHLHPGNILFGPKNRMKVVDFGMTGYRNTHFARFSRPEIQDPWESDRYALGVMWFEMLLGERFKGASTYTQNFNRLRANKNIPGPLLVPLGRLWGIDRYGRKYDTYKDMTDDLHFLREKFAPETPTEPGLRRASAPIQEKSSWWAFWR